jgi:hypothetical protein
MSFGMSCGRSAAVHELGVVLFTSLETNNCRGPAKARKPSMLTPVTVASTCDKNILALFGKN